MPSIATAPTPASADAEPTERAEAAGEVLELVDVFFEELALAMTDLPGARVEILLGGAGIPCTMDVTYRDTYTDEFLAECVLQDTVAATLLQVEGERYLKSDPALLATVEPDFRGSDASWLGLGEIDYAGGVGQHYMFNQIDNIADGNLVWSMSEWFVSGSVTTDDEGRRSYVFGINADALVRDMQTMLGATEPAGSNSDYDAHLDVVTDADGRLLSMDMRAAPEDEQREQPMAVFTYDHSVIEVSPPDPATVFGADS